MRVPSAFSATEAAAMRDAVWRALEGIGIYRECPSSWTTERPIHLQQLKTDPVFQAVRSVRLRAAVDAVLEGQRFDEPKSVGAFFLTFPSAGKWRVPTSGWHIDANYLSALAPPAGVRTHALFGDVGPRGGGTQLVSGSHRLVHKWFTDHPPPRGTRGEEWRRRYAGDVRGQQMGPHPRWRMTVEDLRMLVDYHYWARDRMFEALAPLTAEQFTRHVANSFPSIRETVVHLYTADWGWHLLWQGLPLTQPPSVDSFPDLASVQTVWQDEERKVRGFVENLREADVGGFWPKFLHVVNHASYHRGQVTMMLRQLGVEVPRSQDMIIFSKERSAMESLQAIASAR